MLVLGDRVAVADVVSVGVTEGVWDWLCVTLEDCDPEAEVDPL